MINTSEYYTQSWIQIKNGVATGKIIKTIHHGNYFEALDRVVRCIKILAEVKTSITYRSVGTPKIIKCRV